MSLINLKCKNCEYPVHQSVAQVCCICGKKLDGNNLLHDNKVLVRIDDNGNILIGNIKLAFHIGPECKITRIGA